MDRIEFFSLIVICLFVATLGFNAKADDDGESADSKAVSELEKKIKEYESKISNLQSRENSLSKEVENFNAQIGLIELKIQATQARLVEKENEIVNLEKDIEGLGKRIANLAQSIDFQENILSKRIRERYKSLEDSPVVILLGSKTAFKLAQKFEYLIVLEKYDKKLLTDMNETKSAYGKQKGIFEDKKQTAVEIKAQIVVEKSNLVTYQDELESQKIQKERLLTETQNDESKYQDLLKEAKKELQQIVGAVSVLKDSKGTDVEKGDLIGLQGNTGYSYGEHLHFGVYKYNSFDDIDGWDWYYSNYVDPAKKLKSKSIYWNTGCEATGTRKVGSGDWDWPLSSPTVSQGFGKTCWSNVYYGGKPHPAYDMYGSSGAPVYAVEDGKAYFCKNCLGDGANGVFIFHPDGYMTVYWHLR